MSKNLLTVPRGGRVYNYFRPSSPMRRQAFPPVRLSDDPTEAAEQAAELCRLNELPKFRVMYPHVAALMKAARIRARADGAAFSLLAVDVLSILAAQGGRCAISGLPLDFQTGEGRARPFAPRLQRVDASSGYSANNLQVVCVAMGQVVDDWGLETLQRLAAALNSPSDAKRVQQAFLA